MLSECNAGRFAGDLPPTTTPGDPAWNSTFAGACLDWHRRAVPKLPASFQTLQIIDQWLHLRRLNRHCGHVRPGLDILRIGDPAGEVPLCVWKGACGNRLPTPEMCQVRTGLGARVRSTNGMTKNAGALYEYLLSTPGI